jgi:hypothetical protein
MQRIPQQVGKKGSLKWIQIAVNKTPQVLDDLLLPRLGGATRIIWKSPLQADQLAEYRDAAFLSQVGLEKLASALAAFWPSRGPQWDALACSDRGDVLLVEAKAHLDELCSPGSKASPDSLKKIQAALWETATYLAAKNSVVWTSSFYQLTNRMAHLYFLRKHRIPAWLVLMNFIGENEMSGPNSSVEWQAAYKIVMHVLGLPDRHKLSRYIIDVYPAVAAIKDGA